MLGSKHFPHVPIFIEDFPICSHKQRAHFYGFLWFVPFVPIHFSTVNVTNWLHLMTTFLGAHHPHVPLFCWGSTFHLFPVFYHKCPCFQYMLPYFPIVFHRVFPQVFPIYMSTTSFPSWIDFPGRWRSGSAAHPLSAVDGRPQRRRKCHGLQYMACFSWGIYPLVNVYIAIENGHL